MFLILLVELWIFTGSFHKYFNNDSLFYMTRYPRSWAEFQRYLVAPDDARQYRPLNLGLMALVIPRLGVEPLPYHWVPILFHLLNTYLFYCLARRLLFDPLSVLAATAFWGLHSVAGWITYDVTNLSDFLLASLFLVTLLLAHDGYVRRSPLCIGGSVIAFVLTLLTKEAATTFPLAIWIVLGLTALRTSEEPVSAKTIWRSFWKTTPLAALYLAIAVFFAGMFIHWLQAGLLYAQGSAYDINPWSNLIGKTKYLFWALNLPDRLQIANAERNRVIAFGLMGSLLLVWMLDILKRRGRVSVVEWAGVVWFAGLNVPALLLSSRLAKWYLYIPLFGLALAFGVFAANLRARFTKSRGALTSLIVLCLMTAPILFSSSVQTRSYIVNSDCSFQSDVLQSCVVDFRAAHPMLPREVTLFVLPAFEKDISDLLSAPPVNRGEMYQLYYPGTRFHMLYAHKGDGLPVDFASRSDVLVLQYLDGHLYDVTSYFKSNGKMTLFLLPTSEGDGAPLLKKEPAGGRALYASHVQMMRGDDGATLPADYFTRTDIWILQYFEGRFHDVTRLFRNDNKEMLLVLPTLDGTAPPLPQLLTDPATRDQVHKSRVQMMLTDNLSSLSEDYFGRPDVTVFQYLEGRYYDVAKHWRKGRMTLFLLPTFEGRIPTQLQRNPALHNKIPRNPIQLQLGDKGARLPDDYSSRPDLWILQYMNGHFVDVTDYYKGRRRAPAHRILRDLESVRYSVSRDEYYPNYERFDTPTGAPVFFPTPDKEIFTQVGGSTAIIPMHMIPPGSSLVFDVSWMYDNGDGGWAEIRLRSGGKEVVLYHEYMQPNPPGKGLQWKEVRLDLRPFANQEAELILGCHNDRGKNTISDWLNWRNIVIERENPTTSMTP